MQVEHQLGSVRMFARFILLGFTINLLFTLLCAFGGLQQLSVGLWPLVFAEIVIECMQNPEMQRP